MTVCYGDLNIPDIFYTPGAKFLTEMSTAISMLRSQTGFLVAADGRCRMSNGKLISDSEQKIFPISYGAAQFAFAVTGNARFAPDEDENDIIFDFCEAAQSAATELSTTAFADGLSYITRLTENINSLLLEAVTKAKQMGKKVEYPCGRDAYGEGCIAWVYLCGYFLEIAHPIMGIRFSCNGQTLNAPVALPHGDQANLGSWIVSDLLWSNDPRFSQFIPERQNPTDEKIFAKNFRNYVAACNSEVGLAADPQLCPSIGGHVHIAKVTASRGFEWIEPPLSRTSSLP